jgi:hypothetical protein
MFSSLPDYRRFAEADLQRLRKDHKRNPSNRLGGMMFNLVLLAGLWGVPLYARWFVLSNINPTQPLSEAVVGEWRRDEKWTLSFTRTEELQLIEEESIFETAHYQILGDKLLVSGFTRQPDNRLLPVESQCYQISVRGHRLSVEPASIGFTSIPEKGAGGGSWLRKVLPAFHGSTVEYHRADDR